MKVLDPYQRNDDGSVDLCDHYAKALKQPAQTSEGEGKWKELRRDLEILARMKTEWIRETTDDTTGVFASQPRFLLLPTVSSTKTHISANHTILYPLSASPISE